MAWNPDVYQKFKDERNAPFYDLVKEMPPRERVDIIDLGCGTGALTAKLPGYFAGSRVTGVDSSAEMLQKSLEYASENVTFRLGDIEEEVRRGGRYDMVFSNAALQWVAEHNQLFPALMRMVKPGGVLAVQMPSNHGHISHALLRQLACSPQFSGSFGGWYRVVPVLDTGTYAQLLYDGGAKNINVLEKVYPHVLRDSDAMYDWVSGTALLPYLDKLAGATRDEFVSIYKRELRTHFPSAPLFYPFKRILMVAEF